WWVMPLVLVAVLFAGLVYAWRDSERLRSHSRWHRQVLTDIDALVRKRPAGMTKTRWLIVVRWTRELHCSCGRGPTNQISTQWQERFVTELARRLQRPITLADIDWIWDEYAANTPGGQSYSAIRRSTEAVEYLSGIDWDEDMPVD